MSYHISRASLIFFCILLSLTSAGPPIDSIRFSRVSYSRKGLPVRVILIAEYMRRVGGADKDFVWQYRNAMGKGGARLKQVDKMIFALARGVKEQIQNRGTYHQNRDLISALSSKSFQSNADPDVILVPRERQLTWQEAHVTQIPQQPEVSLWDNLSGKILSGISFTIGLCILYAFLLIFSFFYNRRVSTIKVLVSVELIMLLVAVLLPLQIGYYTLLRITLSGVSVYTFISQFARGNIAIRWVSAIVFILFNPFIPIHFDPETWIVLDLIIWVPIFWILQQLIRSENPHQIKPDSTGDSSVSSFNQ